MTQHVAPAIELRDLRKSFGPAHIIRGASLAVRPGERVAIIGPNGAGKSTLFHLISGRLSPTSGEILLAGRPIGGLRPFEIARLGMSRSFQISSLFPSLSVRENLTIAVQWSLGHRYSILSFVPRLREVNERARQVMGVIGLEERADVLAGNLSYADQRALEIGLTIAAEGSVILLDEPTAGMSSTETAKFVELIRRVSVGRTLLMVEHDMGVVFSLADRIGVLVNGKVLAIDTPDAIRANPLVQEAYLGVDANQAAAAPRVSRRSQGAQHA